MIAFLLFRFHLKLNDPRKWLSEAQLIILKACLTLFDGDVSGVGGGDEGGLRQRVLEREELVLGDRARPRLQDGARADGREVLARGVPQRDEPAVVLDGEVAILERQRRS